MHITRLFKELEQPFEQAKLVLHALGNKKVQPAPAIDLKERPVPKKGVFAEDVYGCDVAITAHVHIADKFEQTSAVLVQVKKPEATENGFRDAWRIDGSQLNDVPKFSQTAVYGLIMPEGTIGVVPARYLAGLRRARPDPPAVMTVSHAHIRSATIPVAQFLVELVLGYVS